MKKRLKIPSFKNENEEREFWHRIDLSDYYERADFVPITFPNLQPTFSKPISIRIDENLLAEVKRQAKKLKMPYQTLMKRYIAEGVLRKRK